MFLSLNLNKNGEVNQLSVDFIFILASEY